MSRNPVIQNKGRSVVYTILTFILLTALFLSLAGYLYKETENIINTLDRMILSRTAEDSFVYNLNKNGEAVADTELFGYFTKLSQVCAITRIYIALHPYYNTCTQDFQVFLKYFN